MLRGAAGGATVGRGMQSRAARTIGLAVLGAAAFLVAIPCGAAADPFTPGITITVPANGAHYPMGPAPLAAYSCSNPTFGRGVVSCLGPVLPGAPIDTATPGPKTFTVTALDGGGRATSATVSYTVDALALPPTAVLGLNSQLLGRTPALALPDAGVSSPTLSHDGRITRYAALVSTATDIVAGSGTYQNVYLVHRAKPWTRRGSPWYVGFTQLISRGLGGAPADGDSGSPAFAGNDFRKPRCVAFVSAAANLVAGDTNGQADVFILGFKTGVLRRIATPGPASAVVVDARCDAYAYVAGGTLYVRDRSGRTRRESALGGVSHPQLSYGAKEVVFERNGTILYRRVGGGQRAFGLGSAPTADAFGRYIAFLRDGNIYTSPLRGGHPQLIGSGVSPAMTSGGHAVLYGQGPLVRLSTKQRPVASCAAGNVVELSTSPHGNYVAFTCSDGTAYLGYVGPQ